MALPFVYSLWGTLTLAPMTCGSLKTLPVPVSMAAAGTPTPTARGTSFTAVRSALPPLALTGAKR